MVVLGIETSTEILSIAVINEKIKDEISLIGKNLHSEKIIPLIDKILRKNNFSLFNIDGISVSIGPGSFTGIRIGLTTARTLACSLKIPLVGVSSLDALAFNLQPAACSLQPDYLVCPLIDAFGGEVYTAIYKNGEKKGKYRLLKIENWLDELKKKTGKKEVYFLGNGADIYKNLIMKHFEKRGKIAKKNLQYNSALSIALIGAVELKDKKKFSYSRVLPLYIKEPAINRKSAKNPLKLQK